MMETRPLGTTQHQVTPIGLGMAALGRPGYITLNHSDDIGNPTVEAMEQNAHHLLDTAYDFGVRYFDMARSYGKAEQFFGSWLANRDIPDDEITIGSKWGYTYTADWQIDADEHEVKEHSLDVLRRQWGETQSNLGDALDIYQIHSATQSSGVLENEAVLDELWRLKGEGTAIGLSLSGPGQTATLQQALTIKDGDTLLFDTVQATWNVLESSAGETLQQAHDAGLGVIVKEVLANGRLTPRSASDPSFAEVYRVLLGQAGRLCTSVDALCTAAALHQPWAGVVLSGAATSLHLISNLAAMNVPWDDEAADVLSGLAEVPEAYWQQRSALEWN